MKNKRSLVALLCAVAAVCAAGLDLSGQSTVLVQPSNLTYLGSFKLPTVSGNGFRYGGTNLAYNAANDSLFVVGHIYDLDTAEVKIPSLGGTGTLLQPLTDATAGKLSQIGSGQLRIGGQLVYNNRLYTTGFIFYDASNTQTVSHFSRPLTLSSGTVTGPTRVGSMGAGYYSGYMGTIPAEWQSRLGGPALTGNCCLSIISRTSFGPAAFSFDPQNMGTAQPLVYYTQTNQTLGTYGASGSHPVFNGTTRITGIVFPEGTASVLFFGMTGIGNYCYGEAAACNDPSNNAKGEHAYPYVGYVWAYNANDLAAVRAGTRQPWQVTPYATWQLTDMGQNLHVDFGLGGAAYDPATGRIFVSKKHGDGDRPVIYVYRVNNAATGGGPAPPVAPQNLRISS